jgi:hypothetical protein
MEKQSSEEGFEPQFARNILNFWEKRKGLRQYIAVRLIVVLVLGTFTFSAHVDPLFCQWLNVSEP